MKKLLALMVCALLAFTLASCVHIHTEVIDEAVAPTCTESGLTEGKHCSECGEVLVKQEIIEAKGHILVNDKCENCDYTYSLGLEFTSNGDGTCYVSGIGTCSDTDVVIPEISPDGDRVIAIGDLAFLYCESLTSIEIPASVTSIGKGAFSGCKSLTSVTFAEGSQLTSIGDSAFYYCGSLTSIEIPADVASIGDYAFYECQSLTSIEIPAGVTSIGDWAFYRCKSLTSIEIPASVTSIGKGTFSGCKSLTSVIFAEGSQLTSIGEGAFHSCTSLTSIEIPAGVTSINNFAFQSCSNLTDVYYTGTEAQWAKISIGSNNSYLTDATIHYNYIPEE